MRVAILLAAAAVASVAAASAHAQARPLRPGDAALLRRAPTPEELVAQAVAKRLTRLSPTVRCGPLGIDVPPGLLVTGRTPTLDLSAFSAGRFAAGASRPETFVV